MKPLKLAWIGLVLCCSAQAQAPASALLSKAWHEYSLQAWPQASSLFKQTLNHPESSERHKRDARFGLAMITQFDPRDPNPAAAGSQYEALLASQPKGDRRLLLLSLYAQCLWETGQHEQADRTWQELINQHPDSLISQDALLQRTLAHMKAIDNQETEAAIHYLEAVLLKLPKATPARPGHTAIS